MTASLRNALSLRNTLAATLSIVGYETVRAPFVVGWPALAMDSTGSAIAAGVESCAKEGGLLVAAAWALFLARTFLRRRRCGFPHKVRSLAIS